uniref:UBA domain-containing protein n=2 Tax=Guillardia theta TaxID=55529 RepID=A0A7S4JIJ9_GUITH|mmetsp:Transcript_1655/g.5022  ORF Transcript_1655/g.5022 Transcript_1655/m.5022 type:complete len:239 (+) Transcript_1655:198-914(+)
MAEIAFAAAEEDALMRAKSLMKAGCSVDQLKSIYSTGILSQIGLVGDDSVEHGFSRGPVVNWESTKAVAEQDESERFPSQEQQALVDEVGNLAARLTAFYMEHNQAHLDRAISVARQFVGREDDLNVALVRKYGCDLTSRTAARDMSRNTQLPVAEVAMNSSNEPRAPVVASAPVEEDFAPASPSAPSAPSPAPATVSADSALAVLLGMGFSDMEKNRSLLQACGGDLQAVIAQLLDE